MHLELNYQCMKTFLTMENNILFVFIESGDHYVKWQNIKINKNKPHQIKTNYFNMALLSLTWEHLSSYQHAVIKCTHQNYVVAVIQEIIT